jgi:hypothetical protein
MIFSVYGVAIGKKILTAMIDNIHFKKDKRLRTNPFFSDKKEFKIKKKIKIKSIVEKISMESKKLSISFRSKLNKKSWQ